MGAFVYRIAFDVSGVAFPVDGKMTCGAAHGASKADLSSHATTFWPSPLRRGGQYTAVMQGERPVQRSFRACGLLSNSVLLGSPPLKQSLCLKKNSTRALQHHVWAGGD